LKLSRVVALLWLLWPTPAFAELITYEFTATITISKWNMIGGGELSASDNAYWFPTLQDGATYAATGTIAYDSIYADGIDYDFYPGGGDIAFVTIGDYTWSIGVPDLGFIADDDSLAFTASFPTIVSGFDQCAPVDPPLCVLPDGPEFFGADGTFNVNFLNQTGSLFVWGMGNGFRDDGSYTDIGMAWSGSIDSVRRVPEPATVTLLLIGLAPLLRRCKSGQPKGT
jgi:hypothetical protein